ncbi:MAG: hypothetical protein V4584_10510 [Verrucomicrobiota bacterium]
MAGLFLSIILTLLACCVSGYIGMAIGNLGGKLNGTTGFMLGFVLGPIGWIITAITALNDMKESSEAVAERTLRKLEYLEDQIAELKAASKAAPVAAAPQTYRLD